MGRGGKKSPGAELRGVVGVEKRKHIFLGGGTLFFRGFKEGVLQKGVGKGGFFHKNLVFSRREKQRCCGKRGGFLLTRGGFLV